MLSFSTGGSLSESHPLIFSREFCQKRAKEYREAASELIHDAIIINESARGEQDIEKRFRLLSNSSLCRRSAREYNELADMWEKSSEEDD